MAESLDLFKIDRPSGSAGGKKRPRAARPLADELRPDTWENFEGLAELDVALVKQLRAGKGKPPSIILWGPPGSGKTTFARLVGKSYPDFHFVPFSAVLGGVKEVREIVDQAKRSPEPTILFIDEIHRFNRGQQDAFLPHVEDGTIILIGATTENPSFYLTGALLSRTKVVVLPPLARESLAGILKRALSHLAVKIEDEGQRILIEFSGGDARRLINLIENLKMVKAKGEFSVKEIEEFLATGQQPFYDRSGEEHYNIVSAFIKSMRGSDPDAALFWGMRMIESGEDPRFVIRRMIIFASEDIGNADPQALPLAVATLQAFEQIGLPEGKIPVAQCITYLSSAPKSNRSYVAMKRAIAASAEHAKVTVPLHLRNAPTKLMDSLGYGAGYQYPHDHQGGHVKSVQYLPDEAKTARFYEPSNYGREAEIAERLKRLRG